MNADINRRARFSAFGMYHLTVALLLGMTIGISLTLGIVLTVPANAAEGYIATTSHGVVISSTLPHCAEEDGGPVTPCTWNVGSTTDGNGVGLAYIVKDHRGVDASFDYVWASSPVHNGWHWERTGNGPSDCVVKAGVNRERCADGVHPLAHR